MIEITAIHLEGSPAHDHIGALQWRNLQSGATGQSTRQAVVDWLEESTANQAVVSRDGGWVYVGVWLDRGVKWLRTHADGVWSDNLLTLPRF